MDIYIISINRNRKRKKREWMQNKKKRDLCLLLEQRMENCQAYTKSSISIERVYLLHASNFVSSHRRLNETLFSSVPAWCFCSHPCRLRKQFWLRAVSSGGKFCAVYTFNRSRNVFTLSLHKQAHVRFISIEQSWENGASHLFHPFPDKPKDENKCKTNSKEEIRAC